MLTLTGYISSSVARAGYAGAGRRLSRFNFDLRTVRKFSSGAVNSKNQALTWITQQPEHVVRILIQGINLANDISRRPTI